MNIQLVLAIWILGIITSTNADGRYAIVGPGVLHTNYIYTVAVSVFDTKEPTTIKVGLTGPSYNESKIVELNNNEVKNIEFAVPYLDKGDYFLTADGLSGLMFSNTTKLVLEKNYPNIKIQTDKNKYRPGDTVHFRVLSFDPNLKPIKPHPNISIWIENEKANRIKQYQDISFVKGVYSNSFQISEFSDLGSFHIAVQNHPEQYIETAYFQVDKYVLPKYVVSMEASDKVSVLDGQVHAIVRANYTYGKPVNGKVVLLVELQQNFYGIISEDFVLPKAIVQTTDMVNGKAKLNFNVKEWQQYLPDRISPYTAKLTATVEENFTGIKMNSTTTVDIYPHQYNFDCISYEACRLYRANKPRMISLHISNYDGSPLEEKNASAKLLIKESINRNAWWMDNYDKELEHLPFPDIEPKTFTFEAPINGSGIATFEVVLPESLNIKGFASHFETNVTYSNENRMVFTSYEMKESSTSMPFIEDKDFFTITNNYDNDSNRFSSNKDLSFTLNSSEPLKYYVYNIIGRGQILKAERVELPTPTKIVELQLKPNPMMAPNGKLYVYYVNDNGEFKWSASGFTVQIEFPNYIEISAPKDARPGQKVDLQIKTPKGSFVGLTAVDQSIIELGARVQIDDIKNKLYDFATYTPRWLGYSHPGNVAGTVTMTNADYVFQFKVNPNPEVVYSPTPQFISAVRTENTETVVPIRKNFVETWIFDNIENTDSETFTWNKKIPDTITSWVLSGFSVHPDLGIGVTKETTKITTFQPFFIAIRLPYSVKRGEVLNVPALVFNYLDKDLDVEITLDNTDGEFDFTDVSNEVINESRRTRSIRVPASEARPASFLIRPKSVGNILLKLSAKSPIAADAIHKTLKVEPEGITKYANRAFFINLNDKPKLQESFELDLPSEVVPDSQHIEFTVVGDLLGPILKNLDRLVRLPTGCGEQTLSAMMPNYYVYKYLANSGQLNEDIGAKLKNNLEKGYQNLLRYAHEDGSFSSFGPKTDNEKPRNGSTWLTAYAMRSLHKIGDLISIDFTILDKGLAYLAARQAENGSFIEQGEFFYSSQNKHISLTAAVVRAFIENSQSAVNYQNQLDKGLNYIAENVDKTDHLYTKVLSGYALHKAKRPEAAQLLQTLKEMARTDEDYTWWSEFERKSDKWWWGLFSNDVEITSYMLLALLDNDHETPQTVLPIVKWLVAQRNSYGGFVSSQDTIVGLQALIKFAEKSNYKPGIMSIDWTAKGAREKRETIKIDDSNGLLLQTNELPQKTEKVEFEASGTGTALVQVSYQYNVVEKDPKPSFLLDAVVNKNSPSHQLLLEVCVEYTGEGDASNMAILEVSLPSGFAADEESFGAIKDVDNVRLVETKNADSVIVVYFSSLPKNKKQCIPIEGTRAHTVAKQKPVSVVVYDYYEINKKATTFYQLSAEICDICDDDANCQRLCT